MHNDIILKLSQVVLDSLNNASFEHGQDLQNIYSQMTSPPNLKMGHYAFPCFPLAKVLRMAPPKIAQELAEHAPTNELIDECRNVGPYLNFKVKVEFLGQLTVAEILQGEFFKKRLTENYPKTMIEYSQPNTHKLLHVGHMRNLCLGNALVHMFRYCGCDLISATYPGDIGAHVAKCLWYLKYHHQGEIPKDEKGAWLGQLYIKANQLLDKEEIDPEIKNQLSTILKELEAGSGEFFELWKETREWSIELMHEAYDWADVKFDRWFWESEVAKTSLELAHSYHKKGLIKESQGAIGMDLSEDKLGFCILIKSDGTGLYSTKDIELAKRKFEEFGIKKNIYIVDNRQAFHFKQVFKVLEKVGYPQAKDCFHLQYDTVELPGKGAASSRTGNCIPLMELVHQMEDMIKREYLNRYLDSWTQEEIDKTATIVANGAIKYGMIRIDNNRKIIFDMAEWLKLDGETGPYLQYVYARIQSLGEKQQYAAENSVDWSLLIRTQEEALMLKLNDFNSAVLQCVDQMKTIHLCSYLFELGKLFNNFYVECSIAKAECETLKHTRLALAMATGLVMKKGLEVLGIPAPSRM